MRITSIPGFPETQSIPEYRVAAAQEKLVFPGVQQCISVTGFSVFGLLGTHVSPGATAEEIEKTFEILRSGGGQNYPIWYVVGNFREHFNYTKVGWNATRKIVKALRENLSKGATYLVFDTSDIANAVGGFGIDIHATRTTFGVDFGYAKAFKPGATVTPITDAFLRA